MQQGCEAANRSHVPATPKQANAQHVWGVWGSNFGQGMSTLDGGLTLGLIERHVAASS